MIYVRQTTIGIFSIDGLTRHIGIVGRPSMMTNTTTCWADAVDVVTI